MLQIFHASTIIQKLNTLWIFAHNIEKKNYGAFLKIAIFIPWISDAHVMVKKKIMHISYTFFYTRRSQFTDCASQNNYNGTFIYYENLISLATIMQPRVLIPWAELSFTSP